MVDGGWQMVDGGWWMVDGRWWCRLKRSGWAAGWCQIWQLVVEKWKLVADEKEDTNLLERGRVRFDTLGAFALVAQCFGTHAFDRMFTFIKVGL
jgi:hypothetical protein